MPDRTSSVQIAADRAPPTPDLPGFKEQLGYVGGEFASNFAWNMIAGFLLIYYTDIAFLPVASLGTLMLVSRVLDAVIDPVVGLAVDRTSTRWGRARPYLLFASIPFGVMCVLTFAVPEWSPTAKVVYGYVTFTLLGFLYSLNYIPYGALQPMMVRDRAIKVRIGGWRSMATSVASVVVYAMVPLMTGGGAYSRREEFTFTAAVVAGITVTFYLIVFFKCRERFGATGVSAQRAVGRDLLRLARNPVWLLVFTYALLTFIRLGVLVSITAFFANYVLNAPWILAVLLPLVSVAIFVGGMFASVTMRRIGQRLTNVIFLVISIGLCLLMPHLQGNVVPFVIAFMLSNVVGGVIGATIFTTCADAVEYNEARFGDPNEGLLFAGVSFGMKVGMAIGAAATAYALSSVGYDPRAVNEGSVRMIGWLFYYAPVVMSVLQLICILSLKHERPRGGQRAGEPPVAHGVT